MINLAIKNMVCPRCIMTVRDILTSMDYKPIDVKLGYATLDCRELSQEALEDINKRLQSVGFELLNNSEWRPLSE